MATITTRRRLLVAAAAAIAVPAVVRVGAVNAAPTGDAELLAHWKERQRLLSAILANGAYFNCETHSPELADKFDGNERAIVLATATTPQGALAQAWIAWACQGAIHNEDDRLRHDLIRAADFDALAGLFEAGMEWEDEVMFILIRSLRGMAGVAA